MFSDDYWMQEALLLADKAAEQGEVPIGAVVVLNNTIIGRGWNQCISTSDPTAHAEVVALRDAAKAVGNYRLLDADVFVSLEPCSMCAGALVHARIRRLVYAANETKAGVAASRLHFFDQDFLNHKVDVVGGVLADQSAQRLQDFFKIRRDQQRRLKE
jgi:tRNA(adenine34) deaminase